MTNPARFVTQRADHELHDGGSDSLGKSRELSFG
jgi:hypothetical protein